MSRRTANIGALLGALGIIGAAAVASAAVIQRDDLRLTVLSQVKPYKLPRDRPAPIAVFVAGHLESVKGGVPPQVDRIEIEVNRNGLLQSRGLAVCQIPRIQPASTGRALANCSDALVGSGQFWAHIVLPGQDPYPTRGRILIFNGRQKGKPVLLTHIFTANPFFSSFVIVFEISRIRRGRFGTRLTASLPQVLGDWGYVDRIKLTLRRKYRHRARQLSYFNARCPAAEGTRSALYQLARATFSFAQVPQIAVTVAKSCGVER